jgi:hypothetical protein
MTQLGFIVLFAILWVASVIGLAVALVAWPDELGSCPSRYRRGW